MKSVFEILFILVMLATGILMCFIAGRNSYRYMTSQNWEPVSAHVIEATWTAGRSGGGVSLRTASSIPVYKATATFEYEFDGQLYSSDTISLLKGMTSNYDQQRRIHNRLKSHKEKNLAHPAFVNPKNPSQAVLIREHSWFIAIIMTGFGMLGFLFAGIGIWSVFEKD